MRKPVLVASIAVLGQLVVGCVEAPVDDSADLDSHLEAFDDGKYDGPILPIDESQQDYKIEVRKIETTEDYGEWQVQPELYLKVNDAMSTACPSTLNCNFDLADVPGTLSTAEMAEARWTGRQLRDDGVEFSVVERNWSSDHTSFVDDIKGLLKIKIGQTGSLRIKPFGKVKSIEFRMTF